MKTIQLGKDGPRVSRVGLGCMSMAGVYGPADDAESIATIHAAIDAGISLVDTGDFYGMGSNEMLIGRALKERNRDDVTISVKFGALRGPDGAWNGYDARPAAMKNFLAYSLTRLGVDHIDIYRPARLDPNVPIEETMGAIRDLIDAGYVRHAGLSEVGPETIRRAAAEAPVSDLQIEYSLVSRGIEDAILPVCRELGIAITAYGILSRGILGGGWKPGTPKRKGDIRARMPRYDADNEEKNLALIEALSRVAQAKGMTHGAGGGRMGGGAGRRHRASARFPHARTTGRPLGRRGGGAFRRRPRGYRKSRPEGRGRRRPLQRGADGDARQREIGAPFMAAGIPRPPAPPSGSAGRCRAPPSRTSRNDRRP